MTNSLPIGPVMLDIAGLTLSSHEQDLIQHPNTGAVILFSRNYQTPEQVTKLINNIRAARNGEILIAVDQEGGRVQRFQTGFTRLPAAARFEQEKQLAQSAGWLMAVELLAVGVDFSFAPVLDVDCGVSEIIGNRAFSRDHEQVTVLAGLFKQGMKVAGMAASGKHFPGHGAVALDSHLALPIDERDLDSIRNQDLQPFKHLIAAGLEGVMLAHIVYPNIDGHAAGFSPFWIQKILREELNFQGAVFSDDLSMEGAASVGGFAERARLAQQAGCDMILVCNNPAAAEQVLEALPVSNDPLREERLLRMKGRPLMNRSQLHQSKKWQTISSLIKLFNQQ
ncbi:MAG: beta-N-acetylhexosaminidase [Methylovulum sp.]|uniref:beta-N-acetylhexosaminidase n=1 Tax=Methylovulum sp. TaxID=1916980 RepID=UPI002618736D|nr:beta-N-acetylhexosaminidase [Methylovulum sp.]MDD2722512.1 beta-N-acetylhexosaminidase [Methylovulum sp.]MDD5123040.1 beta-N-acetylhexosaminidase [Methylovulum sp.]